MGELLTRLGWFDLPEEAQIAICSLIGTIVMGYFFAGVREATLGGVGPAQGLGDLRDAGEKAHRTIITPRWKRRWFKLKIRLGSIWSALRGQADKKETK